MSALPIRLLRQESEGVELKLNSKVYIGYRTQFPISVGMAKLAHSIQGLSIPNRLSIVDLSRGVQYGYAYTFFGRFPDPRYCVALHEVFFNNFFPEPTSKILDDHLKDKVSSVFPADFIFKRGPLHDNKPTFKFEVIVPHDKGIFHSSWKKRK